MKRQIKVLWPDGPRMVSEEWVKSQASDSYYNNADYLRCCKCGENAALPSYQCEHGGACEGIYYDGAERPVDLEDCIAWLEDQGEVTFARR